MLEIRTFGGFALSKNGKVGPNLGSRKAEAMLVFVAVAGRPQNRSVLATLFWPESPETLALTSLRVALSGLRKALGEHLEITHERVGIRPGAQVYLDTADLEEKLAAGQVETALGVYQGDFLQGFHLIDNLGFEDWSRWQQERFHRLLIDALRAAVASTIDAQDYKKGISLVHQLLKLDPLDELAHRQCMLLYALEGKRAAALAQYDQCRQILQSELGIAPALETEELHRQISQGIRPAEVGAVLHARYFPVPQTSFVGRETELAQAITLLRDPNCRLLTLLGPGGIGKTRLALQAVTKTLHSFADGVFFVPLEPLTSIDYLVPAIVDAVGFSFDSWVEINNDQLFDYLRNRSILLVLDGFERHIEGASLLAEIMAKGPGVKLLVTSRAKLGLQGEWVLPLAGLPCSTTYAGDSNALQLFNERARQANINYQLSEAERDPANRICRLMEGMPLGIELAASWTPLLSPAEILREIQKNFYILTTSAHDIPEKHRSLKALFDGSWSLLNEAQRTAFSRLAVFKGGFDWQAALQVTGTGLNELSQLLNKSMLGRDRNGRFSMHGLLRQYALEKLEAAPSELAEVNERHAHYYIHFLLERESSLNGPQLYQVQEDVSREKENLRAAVNWITLNGETETARKVFTAYLASFIGQKWQEGRDAFRDIALLRKEYLLAQDQISVACDPVYSSARSHQAFLMCNLGQLNESDAISGECVPPLRELGLKAELSECLHNLGTNASFRGEYELARELLEQAILLGRECDHFIWPTYLLWYGHIGFLTGDYERGMESFEKCYELYARMQNPWGTVYALSKMGMAADGLGEHEKAIQYQRQALRLCEKTGQEAGKAYALSRMSISAYFLEEYDQAVQYSQESLQLYQELGHRWGICASLCRLGFAWLGTGNIAKAESNFYTGLEQAWQYQLMPQCLYALAGLSAVLALGGEEKVALELLLYVQRHPRTPAIYIGQAVRWFTHPPGTHPDDEARELEPADQVITRWLKRAPA